MSDGSVLYIDMSHPFLFGYSRMGTATGHPQILPVELLAGKFQTRGNGQNIQLKFMHMQVCAVGPGMYALM